MTDPADHTADALTRAAAKVAGWLTHLIDPDQVVELRALKMHDGAAAQGGTGYTAAGTFRGTELVEMARQALLLSGNCQGVYYTLNPLRAERLVRQAPRVQRASRGQTAEDLDVIERRWLLIDIDPVKPAAHSDDSATDEEKRRTLAVAKVVRDYLTGEGAVRLRERAPPAVQARGAVPGGTGRRVPTEGRRRDPEGSAAPGRPVRRRGRDDRHEGVQPGADREIPRDAGVQGRGD